MTKWRKRLDLGSRRAIQREVRELQKVGFISSPVSRTFYEPIKYTGSPAFTTRIAVIILRDGTKLVVVVLGPSSDNIHPWYPYWADILPKNRPLPKSRHIVAGIIKLHKVLCKPVVWAPRGMDLDKTVLDFWGLDLSKRRRNAIRKIIGDLNTE